MKINKITENNGELAQSLSSLEVRNNMEKSSVLNISLEANIFEKLNLSLVYYTKTLKIYFSTTLFHFLLGRTRPEKFVQ